MQALGRAGHVGAGGKSRLVRPRSGEGLAGAAAGEVEVFGLTPNAPAAARVEHADGNDIAARLQDSRRDGIGAVLVVLRGVTHLHAIDPGGVDVVDHREVEFQVAALPGSREVEGLAEPDHPVVARQPGVFPELRGVHRRPSGIVEVWGGPGGPALLIASVLILEGLKPGVALFCKGHGRAAGVPGHFRDVFNEVRHRRVEGGAARPGLGGRAAPGRFNQTNGYVEVLVEAATEEVSHGGKVGDGLRRDGSPAFGLYLCLRRIGHRLCHFKEPEGWVIGGLDFGVGVVGSLHGPRHVRLPGGNPHLADEHVGQRESVGAGDGQRVRSAGGHRRQGEAPRAVGVGARGRLLAVDRHRDGSVRRSPTPHRDGGVALEHHVIGEQDRELEVGGRRTRCTGRGADGQEQRQKAEG